MSGLVFFSSASGNTARFVASLGRAALRIPVSPKELTPDPRDPFVLICPTYADGEGRGAVRGEHDECDVACPSDSRVPDTGSIKGGSETLVLVGPAAPIR